MSESQEQLPRVRTGEFPAVDPSVIDERTKKTLQDVRWLIALGLGSIAAIVIATVSTVAFAQDAGTKAAVEETRTVKAQAEATAKALEQHLLDDAQAKRETRGVLSEQSADIRALYRAVMTGQPQARLERPAQLPDGGP